MLPFGIPQRFQAIIGPNGSGKSNVIDSMLFVFGYRANKIRCKKLSVLLHKSAKRDNTCQCRVSVHFQRIVDKPDGSHEVVAGSEFVISRTAFRDNSSFYTINDRRTNFAEVGKLLKSHDVDLDHNRFLILQGEVESIAMMKPKAITANECGLLEYLEDIVGTSRYKEPLRKITEREELLTEERTEKHNRCKLAEREMNELKEPKNEAVEYLELENELTRTKNLQVQKYVSEQTRILAKLEEEHAAMAAELQAHDDTYKAITAERVQKQTTIQAELDKYAEMAKKKADLEQLLKNSLNKYAELHEMLNLTNKQRKTLKAQLTKEEAALEEHRRVPEKNNIELGECNQKLEKIRAQQVEKENQLQLNLDSLQSETQPIIDRKEKLETELVELQRSVDECKAALALADSELTLCLDNEQTERRKHETLRNALNDARESYEASNIKIRQLETGLPELRQRLEQKQLELQSNRQQETVLVQKIRAQRADVSDGDETLHLTFVNSVSFLVHAIDRGEVALNAGGALQQQGAGRADAPKGRGPHSRCARSSRRSGRHRSQVRCGHLDVLRPIGQYCRRHRQHGAGMH